ncbi:hypothetical protein Zm00014a_028192 [Zea mays]|uniref:Uncharacterized protein n=1 Tax=Zea mays TaxID=4577 RepID=A0A317Y4P8_MAIZE|nr:hypothetical protein Zm00014a_028192 [Zea mays]
MCTAETEHESIRSRGLGVV